MISKAFQTMWLVLSVGLACGCGTDDSPGTDQGDTETSTLQDSGPEDDAGDLDDGGSDTDTDTDTDTQTTTDTAALSIAGTYEDNWGASHEITPSSWTIIDSFGTSVFHVDSYDNDDEYLVAQNDGDNDWNPGLWSRFDWFDDSSVLSYCQIEYAAASAPDAAQNTSADRGDAQAGCGGFAWTVLTPTQ